MTSYDTSYESPPLPRSPYGSTYKGIQDLQTVLHFLVRVIGFLDLYICSPCLTITSNSFLVSFVLGLSLLKLLFFNLLFSEMGLIRVFTQYPPSAAFVSMLVSLPSTVENHFLCSLYSPSLSMASTNMVCPIFVLRVYPCGYILFLASSCI